MTSQYRVDSFHVSVNQGDCAVHLLVQYGATPPKDVVVAAILMDGGVSIASTERPNMIVEEPPIYTTMDWINLNYSFGTETELKFDSIVVTHWDRDHVNGITQLLRSSASRLSSPTDKISFLKWTGSMPNTHFYCPIRQARAKNDKRGQLRGLSTDRDYYSIDNATGEDIVRIKYKPKAKGAKDEIYPFAKFHATDTNIWDVLGVNFFNNEKLSSVAGPLSVTDLIARHKTPKGNPGLYCVGVMKQNLAVHVDSTSTDDVRPFVVDDKEVDETNQGSIAAMVLWEGSPPRASHYFAGDMGQTYEEKILEWLAVGDVNKIRSVKLSHHGSHFSTPLKMFEKFQPRNTFIPTPIHAYFGHPAWPLIFLWYLWSRSQDGTGLDPRLVAGTYPAEISWVEELETWWGIKTIKPALFTEEDDDNKLFQEYYDKLQSDVNQKLRARGAKPLPDERAKVKEYKNHKLQRAYIANRYAEIWGQCGFPNTEYHMSSCGAYSITTGTKAWKSLRFILIKSYDDDEHDGDLQYVNLKDDTLRRILAIKITNAVDLTKLAETKEAKARATAPSALGAPPRKSPRKKMDNDAIMSEKKEREVDMDFLEHARVLEDTVYMPAPTNPGEMDDGMISDEEDTEEDNFDVVSFPSPPRAGPTAKSTGVQGKAATAPATPWAIYTSDISEADILAAGVKASDFERLPFGPLDDFVSDLHNGVLCLESKPPVGTTAVSETRLAFTDQWRTWFSDALNAKELSVITAPRGKIAGFSQLVSLAPLGTGSGPITPAWLKFSSATEVLLQTFGTTTYITSEGLLTGHSSLVFGMELLAGVQTVFLHDLVNFIGMGELLKNPLIMLLGAVPLNVPSTVEELKGKRNAVWFVPSNDYKTTVRLEWSIDSKSREKLNEVLSPLNVKLGPTSVIARRSSQWSTTGEKDKIISKGSLVFRTEVELDLMVLEGTVEFGVSTTTLTLSLNSTSGQVLQTLLKWAARVLRISEDSFDFTTLQGKSTGSFGLGGFHFRRITLNLTQNDQTKKMQLSTFRLDMEMKLSLSKHEAGPTLFMLTYFYQKSDGSTISASLWCPNPPFPAQELWCVRPEYEKYHQILPVSIRPANWQKTLDLAALAGFEDAPSFLPTQVLVANFTADKKGISFQGSLRPKTEAGRIPTLSIGDVTLVASYEWGSKATGSAAALMAEGKFVGYFSIKALIQQPKGAKFGWPTQLIGEIAYESKNKTWTLRGSVYDLYASTLAQFFDKDDSIASAALSVLDSIKVESLEITYTYANKVASKLSIGGVLVLGFHKFTLAFDHTGKDWSFVAKAELNRNHSVKSTIGGIISSVAGSDMNLPDFLVNIKVEMRKEDVLDLVMKKIPIGDTGQLAMVIIATVKLQGLVFQFIQFREITQKGGKPPPVKRVLIASLSELAATAIPMIGKIKQPFDGILFLWVQPQGKSSQPSQPDGLTKIQLDSINTALSALGKSTLPCKVVKANPADQDVLISKGMHFMLMLRTASGKSETVLDYTFEKSKVPGKSESESGFEVIQLDREQVEDEGSSMAPYQKRNGLLSIKNIGLKYSTGDSGKESILSIRLDASVTIGPVDFSLLGFSLGLNFASKPGDEPFSLQNLPKPKLGLEGLSAGFDRPPIEIAGLLRYGNTKEREYFAGALTVSYVPWRFQAAGYYGNTKGADPFETIFLYCVLRGPLITLQFATIEGVCGGFGYNSSLTFPTARDVVKFPLIEGKATEPGDKDGPLDILDHLLSTKWFFPKKGSFWVVAGLTVKAFEILLVQAVIVIQWNPYVELGIFGLAAASIPGGKSKVKFANVELGISASLNFQTGVLKIEGELTPASFILDPNCHLTGGFGLYSWFDSKDKSLRGDWVFTIGGYHPSYERPPQYPTPPRLGISWQFGGAISISGQAYFAITPKVCMGGGRLDVALSLNPLFAYFNAFVDFLINFKPFSFIAEGGLTIGVKFTLDLWLVCININIEIGARLYIKGPPIQGRVHVDFWVFGFDIDFGAEDVEKSKGLPIEEFVEVVCQVHTSGASSLLEPAISAITDTDATDKLEAHVFAVEEGLVPKEKIESTPSGKLWVVRAATFEFSVNCKFVIQEATVVTKSPKDTVVHESNLPGTGIDIFAKPMHATSPITSHLTITIKPEKPTLSSLATEPIWNINERLTKDVPLALWGEYDAASDPSDTKNPSALLKGTSGKSVNLMTGVHLSRPLPLQSQDKTVAFDVKLFQIQTLNAEKPIPKQASPTPAFDSIKSTDKQQWEDVQRRWDEPLAGKDAAKNAVNLWTSLGLAKLGWAEKKVESKAGKLTGAKPRKVIDNIAKYYLWAPLMSGV
ncbi:hypothetical protein H633G_10654 [Metarhizium anisopliae BRIP 53284]|nr:hypothetical protein H633G_10654 [Metarhizium anisopliae BRIP 53284]